MIQPKPFSFQQMLRRTIFKPRPSFFNAEDLNKQFSIIQEYVEKFNTHTLTKSNIAFTVNVFNETLTATQIVRQINIQWQDSFVEAKGVRFSVPFGNASFEQTYDIPETGTPKPPTYICLVAELTNVSYADNTTLAGIQSDQYPLSVPTVDVEQYKNVSVVLTDNPSNLENCVIILGVFHPRYDSKGSELPFGFLYYTMNNQGFKILHGSVSESELSSNGSLFDYLVSRIQYRLGSVLNEIQLVRKFNLSDVTDKKSARKNLGLSNLVNHRQLVRDENLRDLQNVEHARFYLGLGSSATRNVGSGVNDVASGAIMPIGAIIIWSGSPNAIPDGWKLCDGTNNTPDLRGKFVVGNSPGDNLFGVIGQTGGAKGATLTGDNLPNHTHELDDPGHTHAVKYSKKHSDGGRTTGNPDSNNDSKLTEKSFTGITVKPSGGKDNPDPVSILPPYYTLCYIMFVGVGAPPAPKTVEQDDLVYPNFSEPDTSSDGGYSTYTPPGGGEVIIGSGIVVTNPE